MSQRVAILGASNKPERYAYIAFRALQRAGHVVLPVAPALDVLEGVPVVRRLSDITGPVDTLTMYVGRPISSGLVNEVVALRPGRVIFNPGSENEDLEGRLQAEKIPFERACTLVLLSTNQF